MNYRVIDISEKLYTDKLYNEAFFKMSKSRQEKALRYKSTEDRRRCVFADYLLKEMLRDFYNMEQPSVITDEKGKPHLEGDELFISISHSGNFVACAIHSESVGIDLETPRKITESLISYISTDEEKEYILAGRSQSESEVTLRFLEVWTAKEAYLKYTGEGLQGGIQSISVADTSGLLPALNSTQKVHTTREDGYVLSVVY